LTGLSPHHLRPVWLGSVSCSRSSNRTSGFLASGSYLLDVLDQFTPKIQELTRALEEEVEKRPVTRRLMTHPGVGPLTALAYESTNYEVPLSRVLVGLHLQPLSGRWATLFFNRKPQIT
jgi:hypothetical protein